MVCTVVIPILYSSNLVLTSGRMVCTVDSPQLKPCFDERPDGLHSGFNGSLQLKPCFDEWPDGLYSGFNGSL